MATGPTTQLQQSTRSRTRVRVWSGAVAACLALAYVVLLIPERGFQLSPGAGKRPFIWNKDQFWAELERQFIQAREFDPIRLSNQLGVLFAAAESSLRETKSKALPPLHEAFGALETNLFRLAPLVAAGPPHLGRFAGLVDDARAITKTQSHAWDLNSPDAREQLYRLLFGGRMALEMVLVEMPQGVDVPPAIDKESSSLPAVVADNVTLRSGDILLSRGSAPTSSLIARGNDYPGSFSHVALLQVDERTGEATIIESLIERGVVTTPLAGFMAEKRLRLMVLRLRSDLPVMRSDPQLPHRAATLALQAARQGYTPYDFAMDFRDPRRQFCSEVASSAYERVGVRLWMGMTYISSPTLTAWLGSLGVRHFETQEPSDLEYDPQLLVVADWRNGTNLFQAHLDDAVTDTMFKAATPGAVLDYPLLKLPLARLAKAYSAILNAFGKSGPIPEGMSATTALRVELFRENHRLRRERLAKLASEFQARHGYLPPYWELLNLASQ